MPTWPVSLPTAPEGPNYTEQPPKTRLETQMDAGPPKLRQRYTAGVRPLSMTWMLTKAQVAALDTFFTDTLAGGSLSFDGLAHPRTGAAVTFQFAQEPSYVYLGPDVWRATTALRVMP